MYTSSAQGKHQWSVIPTQIFVAVEIHIPCTPASVHVTGVIRTFAERPWYDPFGYVRDTNRGI